MNKRGLFTFHTNFIRARLSVKYHQPIFKSGRNEALTLTHIKWQFIKQTNKSFKILFNKGRIFEIVRRYTRSFFLTFIMEQFFWTIKAIQFLETLFWCLVHNIRLHFFFFRNKLLYAIYTSMKTDLTYHIKPQKQRETYVLFCSNTVL